MLAVYRKLYFLLTKGKQLSPNEQYLKVSVKSKRELYVTGSKPPPLIRRSSFPAQFPEVRSRQAPQRQQSHPGVPPSRRMSVDLAEDDSSPDRRRVRIIRRHWVRRTSRLSTRREWYRQDSGESTSYQVLRLGFGLSTYQNNPQEQHHYFQDLKNDKESSKNSLHQELGWYRYWLYQPIF